MESCALRSPSQSVHARGGVGFTSAKGADGIYGVHTASSRGVQWNLTRALAPLRGRVLSRYPTRHFPPEAFFKRVLPLVGNGSVLDRGNVRLVASEPGTPTRFPPHRPQLIELAEKRSGRFMGRWGLLGGGVTAREGRSFPYFLPEPAGTVLNT